ncbi:MAG: apolipoprotein N-acyltransferase [Bdellovibrionales bacterium]|nr:apolipoprotein N-acyltransferase [Bdellovibrionales bacterium]
MNKRLAHPLIALSALFYVLSFPPYEFAFLGWFTFVPWLVYLGSLQGKTAHKAAWLQGLWLGILISVGGFFWVAYVLRQFGNLPWPVAILGLLFFSLIGQPQFMLAGPLIRKGLQKSLETDRKTSVLILLWIALLFTSFEWLIPKLFRDTFGHHWSAHENLRMNARWAGAYGLTFLATFSNLAIAYFILCFRNRREPSAWPAVSKASPALTSAALMILACMIYGITTKRWVVESVDQSSRRPRLAVIQANIGDVEKLAAEAGLRQARQEVMSRFLTLSDQALTGSTERPMAIVWPETAYPSSFRKPRVADELELDQMVENFSKTRQIPVLFGGYDEDLDPPKKDYNSFFFLSKERSSTDLQVYHKHRLLLFGEELPFSDLLPELRNWFPQVANFGRGSGPRVIPLPTKPTINVAPAICYEVLFPDDMIAAKRSGAELILNITNDSWFGPYAEPQLHLGLSTFRSIELGIPMLRSTNTGISAVVDAAGRILQRTEIGVATVMDAQIPLVSLPPSLVERWGDFFPRLALALSIVPLLVPRLRRAILG